MELEYQFKMAIGCIQKKLLCRNSFIVEIDGVKYLRVAPSKMIFKMVGKVYDFSLFLVPTQDPNFFFFFLKIENISLILWKKKFQVSQIIQDLFLDFNYNKLQQMEEILYIKLFNIELRNQREIELMDIFSSSPNIDISSVLCDFSFSIEGEPEETGINYKFNKNSIIIKEEFIFGLIHGDVDLEIRYPIFSYLSYAKNKTN